MDRLSGWRPGMMEGFAVRGATLHQEKKEEEEELKQLPRRCRDAAERASEETRAGRTKGYLLGNGAGEKQATLKGILCI